MKNTIEGLPFNLTPFVKVTRVQLPFTVGDKVKIATKGRCKGSCKGESVDHYRKCVHEYSFSRVPTKIDPNETFIVLRVQVSKKFNSMIGVKVAKTNANGKVDRYKSDNTVSCWMDSPYFEKVK